MRRYSRKKNSTKIFLALTIVVAVAFGITQFFLKQKERGDVVAKINGEKIYKSQIEQKLVGILSSQGQEAKTPEIDNLPQEVIEILAKEIYLEEQLTKIAKKSDAAKSKEVQARINDIQGKILRQAYVDSIIKNEITEEKINDKYAQLTNELAGKKEYLVSHLIVKTKEEAEKISKDLTAKKALRFSDAAKKYSLDKESSDKGGELGYVLEDNIIKEISEVVTKLKKDEISAPIQTKFGWHLVKFSDVRDAKALPFESVKDNIREQLIQDRLNEINSKIIKDAKIEILLPAKNVAIKAEENNAEAIKADDAVQPASELNSATPTNAELTPTQEQPSTQATEKSSDEKADNKKSKSKKRN